METYLLNFTAIDPGISTGVVSISMTKYAADNWLKIFKDIRNNHDEYFGMLSEKSLQVFVDCFINSLYSCIEETSDYSSILDFYENTMDTCDNVHCYDEFQKFFNTKMCNTDNTIITFLIEKPLARVMDSTQFQVISNFGAIVNSIYFINNLKNIQNKVSIRYVDTKQHKIFIKAIQKALKNKKNLLTTVHVRDCLSILLSHIFLG